MTNPVAFATPSGLSVNVQVTETGLILPDNLSFDEWWGLGETLQGMHKAMRWWVGDWLNYGERRYGDMYPQAIRELTGYEYQTLADAKWVCKKVEFSLRKENLSWTHHVCVASLPTDEQSYWLDRAQTEGLRSGELRAAIKGAIVDRTDPDPPFANNAYYEMGEDADRAAVDVRNYDVDAAEWKLISGPMGNYRINGDTKRCEKCGQLWAADIDYCPYCNLSADMRVHLAQVAERPHVSYNSGNNDWYTPAEYIAAARAVMGRIDLDPASSHVANETVGANLYYTIDDDGLAHPWAGRVWMNPPYADKLIDRFADKLAGHYSAGDVEEAIVLVNNATETRWFRRLISVASAVVFPSSRVRFIRPLGDPGAPLQGQAVIYLGDKPEQFRQVFGDFGWSASL